MTVNKTEKQELLEKLNLLLRKQSQFQQEINELQRRIVTLQVSETEEKVQSENKPEKVEILKPEKKVEKAFSKTPGQRNIVERMESKIGSRESGISSEIENHYRRAALGG